MEQMLSTKEYLKDIKKTLDEIEKRLFKSDNSKPSLCEQIHLNTSHRETSEDIKKKLYIGMTLIVFQLVGNVLLFLHFAEVI